MFTQPISQPRQEYEGGGQAPDIRDVETDRGAGVGDISPRAKLVETGDTSESYVGAGKEKG